MPRLEKRSHLPVLTEPIVALRKQQASSDDRLQQPLCEYVGLVALNVRVEHMIDVVRVIQADETAAELAKRDTPICVIIGAEGSQEIGAERADQADCAHRRRGFEPRQFVCRSVRHCAVRGGYLRRSSPAVHLPFADRLDPSFCSIGSRKG
jgi:hypothetical protein